MSAKPKPSPHIPETDFIPLPEAPHPGDINNWIYFNSLGNGLVLTKHLGNEASTLLTSRGYIAPEPTRYRRGLMAPDLLVAFNVNPALGKRRNGYVISDHGKPPDFVLEIGSHATGQYDATVKRDGYARLGVLEYWRFNPADSDYQGGPLAGDMLVDGVYQPIPIEEIDAETHQGYSPALNLHLRWEYGGLGWHDPATGQHIPTLDSEMARADAARADAARAKADAARAKADAAEARLRELEAELERRQQP